MLRMADFLPFFHKVFPFWKIGHFFCPFLDFGNTFDPLISAIFFKFKIRKYILFSGGFRGASSGVVPFFQLAFLLFSAPG